jgi:hypothetical protein
MPNAHPEFVVPVIQEDEMHKDTEMKTNVIEGKYCALRYPSHRDLEKLKY